MVVGVVLACVVLTTLGSANRCAGETDSEGWWGDTGRRPHWGHCKWQALLIVSSGGYGKNGAYLTIGRAHCSQHESE